ncbi:OLC1v1024100C1 [Oldenlandia corymbosa var. corymbosa]|uniref:OLC1v1024100C1 n=1 Tax=Oldenlandia corymbosa var. corymbosa TaxID=529605 RepID=A0AAV1C367_OLDCO|nr:OLC1v1024100C1 [Oldenlandia corymbosa var. corymbosa]
MSTLINHNSNNNNNNQNNSANSNANASADQTTIDHAARNSNDFHDVEDPVEGIVENGDQEEPQPPVDGIHNNAGPLPQTRNSIAVTPRVPIPNVHDNVGMALEHGNLEVPPAAPPGSNRESGVHPEDANIIRWLVEKGYLDEEKATIYMASGTLPPPPGFPPHGGEVENPRRSKKPRQHIPANNTNTSN